jgi:predicted nuclease of predicted toxin-antitoxin system
LKFLVDMNLSPLWIEAFADRGFGAVHWSRVGDPGARDLELMQLARAQGYVDFTHDLDLSRILALTRAEGPSVLRLRSQAVLPEDAGPLIFAALREHESLLDRGALVVVDATTPRARILPIK